MARDYDKYIGREKRFFETIYPIGQSPNPKKPMPRFKTLYDQISKSSKEGDSEKGKKLDQMVVVISAALIGGSALFLSSNLTGNVIWNLPRSEINLVGIVMFVVGIVGLFASLREK